MPTFEQSLTFKTDPATIREMTEVFDRLRREHEKFERRQMDLAILSFGIPARLLTDSNSNYSSAKLHAMAYLGTR